MAKSYLMVSCDGCPICMNEQARGVVAPPCGHQLCMDCYNRIFHMAVLQGDSVVCPTCRATLFEAEDSDEDEDLEEFRISQNWWTLARDSEPHVSLQLTPINQYAIPLFQAFQTDAYSLLPFLCELGMTRRVILPGYTHHSSVGPNGVSRFIITIIFCTRSDALAVAQALSDKCEFLLNWRDDGSHLVGLQASDGFGDSMGSVPIHFSIAQQNVPRLASRSRDLYHIIEDHNVRPTYLPHNWALLQLVAKFFPPCPDMPPHVNTYRHFELPQDNVGADDAAIMRRIIDTSPTFT